MSKKSDTIFTVLCVVLFLCVLLFKFFNKQDRSYIFDMPTDQAFLQEQVKSSDIEKILNAGINAPSGLNKQPWHFCVMTNDNQISKKIEAQLNELISGKMQNQKNELSKAQYGDAPLIIHVYCDKGGVFDAGLAFAQMNIAAHELGYGTKIVGMPAFVLKGDVSADYKQLFNLPPDSEYVSTLLIGKVDKQKNKQIFDAQSGATPRKAINEVVSFPGRGF